MRTQLKRLGRLLLGDRLETQRMDMNCFPEEKIREVFSDQGVRIVDVKLTNSAQGSFNGDLQFLDRELKRGWVSKQYCVVKAA